jgi:uncharacterized protein (TIGR03435 family)
MKALTVCACLVSCSLGFAGQETDNPSFEVASIKPSDPNPSNPMWIGMSADRALVTYTNITLMDCIRAAYRVRDFQITGPAWINESRFEITAKLAAGTSPDQIPEMMQALLAERFKLTLHREMKEQSVYALIVGKDGPKLKAAERRVDDHSPMALGPDGKPRAMMMFRFSPSGVTLTTPSASVASLAGLMSRFTERPVVDLTGLEGQYDFSLTFMPETTHGLNTGALLGPDDTPRSSDPAPSMFEAVRQYGLRLEARKAAIEMFTVTHVERTPLEN